MSMKARWCGCSSAATARRWQRASRHAALDRRDHRSCSGRWPSVGAFLLPRAFLPPFNEGTFTINMLFNPGISLAESNRVGLIAERLILEVPEVKSVGRRTGRAELDEHAEGVHSSEIEVDLKASARREGRDHRRYPQRLAVLPLVDQCRPADLAPARPHAVRRARRNRAQDLRRRSRYAAHARPRTCAQRLAKIPGLADLQVEKQVRIPQLEIRVDYGRAALYGVQPAAVVEQLSRLSNGRVVSARRRRLPALRRGDAPAGSLRTTQRLGDLADRNAVGLDSGAADRRHQGNRRSQPDPARERPAARRRARQHRRHGRHGEASSQPIRSELEGDTAAGRLFHQPRRHVPGAGRGEPHHRHCFRSSRSSLIFAILYSRYRSAVLALIIMGSVPLALIGSVAALWLAGQPLSVASMIGFITLTGIAARNGILKISHYINLCAARGHAVRPRAGHARQPRAPDAGADDGACGRRGAVAAADRSRRRPGKEILHPVAVTIFGGLISATLLDAFLTPMLFLKFGRRPLERLRAL